MALNFGNLLGAVSQASSALSKPKTLKSFLDTVNNFGVQVTNNFEVNFSGIPDIVFYFQSINIPGMELRTSDIAYDGKTVEIPVNYDYQHDFNATVINDGQGYIYSAIANFFMSSASLAMASSGFVMTIKSLTGDPKYKGMMYTLYGVKLTNIGNIEFSYSNNDVQTFTLNFKCSYYTATPGALASIANLVGAVNSLIG